MPSLLLRNVVVDGRGRVDVRLDRGRIEHVSPLGPGVRTGADQVVEGDGALLLPGLHDHHCHLLAEAARAVSVDCGPPAVRSAGALRDVLHRARPIAGWIRGTGYDESAAGELDRLALDRLRADVPVRVQHRSGALWVVNTAGCVALGLSDGGAGTGEAGVERDAAGRATGRLWRADRWLGARTPGSGRDAVAGRLHDISRRLAACGVTGVTDATPELTDDTVALLRAGTDRQRLTLLGERTSTAPWKIVVADHDLPGPELLQARVLAARPRPVAVHCVSLAALVLTASVLTTCGVVDGDRVEHAAVAGPDAIGLLRRLGVRVVTQPSLVARRGDDYLDRTDGVQRPWLWPYRSLLTAGLRVAPSSDAPYGDLDPWAGVRAAVHRRTPSGRTMGPAERVSAGTVLAGYLGAADDPGGPARRVAAGQVADLVLLDGGRADVLADPVASRVRLTVATGAITYDAADGADSDADADADAAADAGVGTAS